MEASSSADDVVPPESWEVADVDESMKRLMLSSSHIVSNSPPEPFDSSPSPALASISGSDEISEDVLNQVDKFLREALQKPRERLSVLRMEQDIEKFIRDPTRQYLEFQQLPTSYLRLAAHRVASHYSLQSLAVSDDSLPDGAGQKIIVYKTSEYKSPLIRLADIPVNLPSEDCSVLRLAIKQRPQKQLTDMNSTNRGSLKSNSSKSMEERKEEYNRARARIFNSSSGGTGGRTGCPPRLQDNTQHGSLGILRTDERPISGVPAVDSGRGLIDPSTGSSRSARSITEKEPIGRNSSSNRVAIFRDREVDRKDPDYDRSYERYVQRFDPGFGFNGGSYAVQPMFTPAFNYNTEFPQLGSSQRPQISAECHQQPHLQHMPGTWATLSNLVGIGYRPGDEIMRPYNLNHMNAHSSMPYPYSAQYPCQHPGLPLIHPPEDIHQTLLQSRQQQNEGNFGLAPPR